MRKRLGIFPGDDLVDQQGQRAGGRDGRVELAQRPGGGVAWVEVGLLPGFLQFAVEFLRILLWG